MNFSVRFTEEALDDLDRLYPSHLAHCEGDWEAAEGAIEAIHRGLALLESSPFASRRVSGADPMHRELLVGFGAAGYVLLVEIDAGGFVTVLAARHQREDDYR